MKQADDRRLRLISISDQPREYLLAKCIVDVGQVLPLPGGEIPEIAFKRWGLGIAIVHSLAVPADY